MAEKPTFEQFTDWAKGNLGFDPSDRAIQNWVDANVISARSQLQQHVIASRIQNFIETNQAADKRKPINIVGNELQLHIKSYSSILSKLYRQNVIQNNRFPDSPKRGWITPRNMYGRVNDLVRSKIVCRHIDEPERIAKQILVLCAEENLRANGAAQTRDDGYYAYHLYIRLPMSLDGVTGPRQVRGALGNCLAVVPRSDGVN